MVKAEDLSQQLRDCEQVLTAADVAINKQADIISMLDDQNVRLQKALDIELATTARLSEDQHAWYRNPAIVGASAFVVGFVLGAYSVRSR